MRYSEAKTGRMFVLRLEDGDKLPQVVEDFAADKGLKAAVCWLVGGMGGGRLVVGPKDGAAAVPDPILKTIAQAHEAAAVGTIFPDQDNRPVLHMHAALGRDRESAVGCVRPGVEVWLVAEVVILEILDSDMVRRPDPKSKLVLLDRK
ncbi:MAG: DNA-binding protein [Desulfovibrionaceae bacterium]|nr:DNA-binding protein [Desulfovibrionaceae bacterium]